MFTRISAAAIAVAAVALGATSPALAQSRDQIRIVGSSTVYPFTSAVAEAFGRAGNKTPVVESTGTGGGLKLFCAGVGAQHPDIANASRRIKASEVENCAANGVTAITELKIGFDGIVVASSKAAAHTNFTLEQIFRGLAKDVPVGGKMAANPARKWSDVDKTLPGKEIEVLGPPPTSGTRDSFNELAMEGGCKKVADLATAIPDEKVRAKACMAIREDGAYIEAGENDNLIVQKLVANKDAFGVFGFSFYEQNSDKIQVAKIDGIEPTVDTISSGKYPIARAMYVYVKNAHVGVVPGIREFLGEYTADKAMGPDGYLADKGLVPLPDKERAEMRANVVNLTPLKL